MAVQTLDILAGIAWDPQIRGFLATLVGVVVLMGSVHLLLATNLANRLGFLMAAAGFFGWMVIMGAIWWIYGIGMVGSSPSWNVNDVNFGDLSASPVEEATRLDASHVPTLAELSELEPEEYEALAADLEDELAGWELLPESAGAFGEAKATVDEHFTENPVESLGIEGPSDYLALGAFERGGKDDLPDDPNRWDRISNWFKTTFWQVRHPVRHAIVQVQAVVPQETEPGQAPPTPIADEDTPVISVVLERDIGDRRFPAAMITIGSGLIFGLLCNMLHRRDRRVAEVRGLVPATTGS